ncbi:MAG TPA: VOC family protein [Planctomycetota bacterium]|nr:VOC family protein [Planctomycetota bacterium]
MAKKATNPIPQGYHSVQPSLTCRDAAKAIEFWKKALGAEEVMCMRGPGGRIMHAEVRIGNSVLMLNDELPDMGCHSPQQLNGSPVSFYVYVEDVDASFKRAVEAGATAEYPVMDMFWGDRTGSLKDPFGFKWVLASRTRELTEAEIMEGQKEFFANMAGKK